MAGTGEIVINALFQGVDCGGFGFQDRQTQFF